MNINSFVDMVISIFNTLWNFKIFNVSIVIWLSIPLVFDIIWNFVIGVKDGKSNDKEKE